MDGQPDGEGRGVGLVLLLAVHAGGGIRLLALEFLPLAGLAAVAGDCGRVFGCVWLGLRAGVVAGQRSK